MSILDLFALDGRVALVTGAGKGIGAASALGLADAGADVALVARTAADLERVAAQVRERGRRAHVITADLSRPESLAEVVTATVEALGGVDILVNNAGGSLSRPFLDTSFGRMVRSFEFNVASPVELARLAVPHMLERGGGAIVNIASMAARHASRGSLAYGTAKAALAHATELMAVDLAPRVRVNAVLPGAIETEALRDHLDTFDPAVRGAMERSTLMRRNGSPDDIAAAVVYLASPAARWVSGKLLEVDGGYCHEIIPSPLPDL